MEAGPLGASLALSLPQGGPVAAWAPVPHVIDQKAEPRDGGWYTPPPQTSSCMQSSFLLKDSFLKINPKKGDNKDMNIFLGSFVFCLFQNHGSLI